MLTRRTITTSATAVVGIGLGATLQIANAETRWPNALTEVIGEIDKKAVADSAWRCSTCPAGRR